MRRSVLCRFFVYVGVSLRTGFMAGFTYRQLRDWLDELNDEQLDSDVTVVDLDEEYHAVSGGAVTDASLCDVLDPEHPILLMD